MEVSLMIVIVLLSIVATNVAHHLWTRLPLPLLQIIVGCLLAFVLPHGGLLMGPEWFMILIIAPLLFREADNAEIMGLWNVRRPVFFMAFALVFITVISIGFLVRALFPAVHPAVCFALGAILGPTDLIAVSSLSKRIVLEERLNRVLQGEGLINDASGLIALRFAAIALATGSFSALEAVRDLLYAVAVGIFVGYILSKAERMLLDFLSYLSVENTACHLLVELLMPVICYIAAEHLGASGVLAAVTAGLRQTPPFKTAQLEEAEYSIVKRTVWDTLNFGLNSFVFVLLGLQLPGIVHDVWGNYGSNLFLVLFVLLITLALVGTRFICLLPLSGKSGSSGSSSRIRDSLILSLSGVKGAVSLAAAFSLPMLLEDGTISEHPLLLFLTAGVIVVYLVASLVLLPLIADRAEPAASIEEARSQILTETIRQLQELEGTYSMQSVIADVQKRLNRIEGKKPSKSKPEHGLFRGMIAPLLVGDEVEGQDREERRTLRSLRLAELHEEYREALLMGFYVERRVIYQFLDAGKIAKDEADILRLDVSKLEIYMLGSNQEG